MVCEAPTATAGPHDLSCMFGPSANTVNSPHRRCLLRGVRVNGEPEDFLSLRLKLLEGCEAALIAPTEVDDADEESLVLCLESGSKSGLFGSNSCRGRLTGVPKYLVMLFAFNAGVAFNESIDVLVRLAARNERGSVMGFLVIGSIRPKDIASASSVSMKAPMPGNSDWTFSVLPGSVRLTSRSLAGQKTH